MGCLWCGKYSRQRKTIPFRPPEFIPPFIPVTGMKCSCGKISSPLTEISVGKTKISATESVRPLIWTHRKFYKGFRGKVRSRKPGQPGEPGSYEEALRWLNTVLAVSEYMSLAKSIWQEKGCSSQAETWQVKNILMKDFDWQVKCDVFVVSMATWTIEYNLKISLLLSLHKIRSLDFPINLHTAYYN